jgi:DNA/RNA endonuclease YhcR with UshA esterase domain
VNGLGNIVAGEEITLEGEQSFVLGRNLAYKGSGGVVVTNNKDVVGDQRMLLGEFIIEIDSYRNDRTVKLV